MSFFERSFLNCLVGSKQILGMGMRIRMRRIARLRGSTMARYCKYCSYCTVLTLLWSILSLLSAVLTSLGLYFSNWLQRETSDGTFNSVSAYRLCLNESSQLSVSCDSYFTFSEIYSAEWQAVTLLMGLGVCLLVFIALLSIFVFFVHKYCNKFVVFIMALLQCLGGTHVNLQSCEIHAFLFIYHSVGIGN